MFQSRKATLVSIDAILPWICSFFREDISTDDYFTPFVFLQNKVPGLEVGMSVQLPLLCVFTEAYSPCLYINGKVMLSSHPTKGLAVEMSRFYVSDHVM